MTVKKVQDYSFNNGTGNYANTRDGKPWTRNPYWLDMPDLSRVPDTINTDFNIGTGFNAGSTVYVVKVQSDDKVLCGGNFTSYNGTSCNCIVRLNTDGSIDSSFVIGTGFNSTVNAIAIQTDGKILIGGAFTEYNGTSSNYIIRLNTNGSVDTSFVVGTGFDGQVRALAIIPNDGSQYTGRIYVGGSFGTYQGSSYSKIIRLTTTGSIDTIFSIGSGFTGGDVFCLGVRYEDFSQNKVLAGGNFTAYNGSTKSGMIRIIDNGTIDSLGTQCNLNDGTVFSLSIMDGGWIIIGGSFQVIDSSVTRSFAILQAFSLQSQSAGGISPSGVTISATALSADSSYSYVGGAFTTWTNSVQRNRLVRLNNILAGLTGSRGQTISRARMDSLWGTKGGPDDGAVFSIAINSKGNIIASGDFTTYGGVSRRGICEVGPGQSGQLEAMAFLCTVHDVNKPISDILGNISITSNNSLINYTNAAGDSNQIAAGNFEIQTSNYYNNEWQARTQVVITPDQTNDTVTIPPVTDRNRDYPEKLYQVGDRITFANTFGSNYGINSEQVYYIVDQDNSDKKNLKVSTSRGGTPVDIINNPPSFEGLPYQQAIIVITPGLNGFFQTVSFSSLRTTNNPNSQLALGVLDMALSLPNCSSLLLGAGNFSTFSRCEQASIYSLGTTNLNNLFLNFKVLKSVPALNVAPTSAASMFNGCSSLEEAPQMDTSNCTEMGSMFNNCVSLTKVPLYNTANVTNMNQMFNSCTSLQSVPLFNTAKVTTTGFMFNGCTSLKSVPLLNTVNVTNMNAMFQECYSLQSVPLFDTANVTSMQQMFFQCYSLQSVPLFNTAKVIDMTQMFNECRSLKSVPLFNTANVNNMTQMFSSCRSLKSVPLLNTVNVTNMNGMFNECRSLQLVPLFNTANVISIQSMFNNCHSLLEIPAANLFSVTSAVGFADTSRVQRSLVTDLKVSHSYTNCTLSPQDLNEIYTLLPTVSMGAGVTITVTGNWGTASDNPAIATGKNWTVVG